MTPALIIEGLVIILLIATIGFCVMLNRRLKMLKADETALRSTVAELLTATEIAERAIKQMKISAYESHKNLSLRVRDAERINEQLEQKLEEGDRLMTRLVAITQASTGRVPQQPKQHIAPSRKPATRSEPRTISEMANAASKRAKLLSQKASLQKVGKMS